MTRRAGSTGKRARAARQVYRQPGAMAIGAFVCVAMAVLLVLALLDGQLGAALLPLGVTAVVVGMFLRPHVMLDAEGIHLANPVRTADINWAAFELVLERWALKVETTTGQVFGSWAIASQRASGASLRGAATGALAPKVDTGSGSDRVALRHRPGSAGFVGARIRQAHEEYERAVRAAAVPVQQPHAGWKPDPIGIALIAGGLVLCVLGILLF